jgi:hypothetical protein
MPRIPQAPSGLLTTCWSKKEVTKCQLLLHFQVKSSQVKASQGKSIGVIYLFEIKLKIFPKGRHDYCGMNYANHIDAERL